MSSITIYGATPIIGTDSKFHYVYRITNIVEGKYYYGVHSCKTDPYKDLGVKYFCSIANKDNIWIKCDQKINPQNYKYKILAFFIQRNQANDREIYLHKFFNVKTNIRFYNGTNASSNKFDQTGMSNYVDAFGEFHYVSNQDPRVLSGDLIAWSKGFANYVTVDNSIVRLPTSHKDVIEGNVHTSKNCCTLTPSQLLKGW